ncbi:uncharacterized protein LOC134269073 isoform X2 [Saccostrea cucullata]|uniref:uncharacterized protein LOC134269073 isoform X2 n=1 Tax=Saccostrea cuccullata TaxID=36930 RepID=UPI002ED24350
MGRLIFRTFMIRKLIYIFFVQLMNYNALCKVTTNAKNDMCVHAWKSDLGATNSSTHQLINHLQKLENLIRGVLSSKTNTGSTMKVDLEKCTRNTDCKIKTISDKTKKDSLLICIKILDTDTCYKSNCSIKERHKRGIDTIVDTNETSDQIKKSLKDVDLSCNFEKAGDRYEEDKPVNLSCQNESRHHAILSTNNVINSFQDTSTIKPGCISNSQTTKETNAEIYVMICLGGTLFGLLIGIFGTCVFLKRVPKNITVNLDIHRNNNIPGTDTLNDIPEYSEIPCTREYFKVEETFLSGEKTEDFRKHRDEDNKLRKYLQTSPSMIVQVDISEPLFQSNSYPKMELQESNEYVEPLCHEYRHLIPMNTIRDVIMEHASTSFTKQVDISEPSFKDESYPKQEMTHRNTTNETMQPQDQKDKDYLSNTEVTETDINTNVVQQNLFMSGISQKRKVGETKMCTSKDEREAADSVYFVLNTEYPNSTEDDATSDKVNGKLCVELEKIF